MYIFAAAVVIATALASIAIWSPRRVTVKVVAVACAVLLMPTAYAAFVELMGAPKPERLEWFRGHGQDARVLGTRIREGEAIYLWLQFEGAAEPLSYRLPWSERIARQMSETMQRTRDTGENIRFRWAGRNREEDGSPLFYAEPPPPRPPKYGAEQQPETRPRAR